MTAAVIARTELRILLRSPIAWATLSSVCALLAWLFLLQIDQYTLYQSQLLALANPPGVTELVAAPLFGNAGLILMMVLPLITMRSFAEQERNQTLTLLTTAPISLTAIVVGKFFGICGFLALLLTLLLAMPLSLIGAAELDFGLLAANSLGVILLVTSFTAIGLWASSLTSHPGAAAMLTFGLLLILWLLESARGEQGTTASLAQFSTLFHYQGFLNGLVSSGDIAYFVILTLLALGLTVLRLHSKRYYT
ncbi:MAG: ABC transporter permease [Gammaproteobacteria bacterium]|nr:MAG: ABC transporter permease [Gammaproteobacteria bacterium]RLA16098.1 MAG: ABC transporter permease [Gammaproteobacteria bacterium]RLA18215.1 MAG: ABC transporter permease [Gammaproteobacteria bacterium]